MSSDRQATYAKSPRDIFRLGVQPTLVEATAGQSITIQIGLQNLGTSTRTIQLLAEGVPDEWLLLSHETITLEGGERTLAEVQVWPSGDLSGEYPVEITAHLSGYRSESVTLRSVLSFATIEKFDIDLRPSEVNHGKKCEVSIHNQGNTTTKFTLSFDPADEIDAVGPPLAIEIPAGVKERLHYKLSYPDRKFFGQNENVPFILTVESETNKRKKKYGTLKANALLPVWAPFVLLMSVAVLVSLVIWANRPPPPLPYERPTFANLPPDALPCDETRIMSTHPSVIISEPVINVVSQETLDAQIELGTPVASTLEPPPNVPKQAFQAVQFLELPFPYDGGNTNFGGTAEQFRRANRSSIYGGRINGFFDHYYPLYPAPTAGNVTQGREPAQEPIGRNMLIFDGSLVPTNYSGHPGYDYSPFEHNKSTTPLFAAADGIVESVDIHQASGAYFVRILHRVEGVGNYLTIYWHLEPDDFFEQMRPRVGQPIQAGERIGTIGNTGWSTGHHLHFEVRFDGDRNGVFGVFEKVDPFGFVPSAEFPVDPWSEPFQIIDAKGDNYVHNAIPSRYLWKHSMGFSAAIPNNGGGVLPSGGTGGAGDAPTGVGGAGGEPIGCAPPSTLPAGGTINWLWSPDPAPTIERAGMGQGCALSVFEADGKPLTQFAKPIRIELPYNDDEVTHLDAESLMIWWKSGGTTDYVPIPTTLTVDENSGQKYAVAYTDIPGHCALMGRPTQDFFPPKSHILIEGAAYDQYSFAGDVRITLTSDAPDLDRIEFSLDGGTTWEVYSEPFEIVANGSPPPLHEEVVEGLPQGTPGLNLLLVVAYDTNGNLEEPHNSALIIIDPDKGSGNPARRVVPHPCCED